MIRKLIGHKLDFELVLNYVKDNLDDLNTLSKKLLNTIDFKTGHFFYFVIR
jgi:hypothetical protein